MLQKVWKSRATALGPVALVAAWALLAVLAPAPLAGLQQGGEEVSGEAALVLPQDVRPRTVTPRFAAELWAGLSSPKGDLAEVNADGAVAAVGVAYAVGPRAWVKAQLAFENLERGGTRSLRLGGVRGPNTHLWHLLAGLELELTPGASGPWHVTVAALGGATYQDVGEPLGEPRFPDAAGPFEGWVPTGAGDLAVGYDLARAARVFARGGAFVMFGDAQDPEGSFLGKEATLVHAVGLRFQF